MLAATRQQAIEQAGIATAMHHIRGLSGDTASRSPIMAPWSIYPFSPEECAALICDLLIFETIVSGEALVAGTEQAGLLGELLLTPADVQVGDAMCVLRAHWHERALTWHAHSLGLLLYELVEPGTLARGTKAALQLDARRRNRSWSTRARRVRGCRRWRTTRLPHSMQAMVLFAKLLVSPVL